MELTEEEQDRILTPSKEEQLILELRGKCPHNRGWIHDGHGHNDDAYRCRGCGLIKFW